MYPPHQAHLFHVGPCWYFAKVAPTRRNPCALVLGLVVSKPNFIIFNVFVVSGRVGSSPCALGLSGSNPHQNHLFHVRPCHVVLKISKRGPNTTQAHVPGWAVSKPNLTWFLKSDSVVPCYAFSTKMQLEPSSRHDFVLVSGRTFSFAGYPCLGPARVGAIFYAPNAPKWIFNVSKKVGPKS